MLTNVFGLMAALAFAPAQDPAPVAEAPSAADVILSPIPEVTEDELVLGEVDAPVTLVAYTSMICINCAAWHAVVLPRLIEREIATGRVRLVLRQIPTNPVQVSAVAAGIIRCSARDNQMNVAGALFGNLEAFREGETMTDLDWHLTGIAASGRTREEVEACLTDPATLSAVHEAARAGRAAGVSRVPAVFVNGTAVAVATADDISLAVELAMPAAHVN